MPSVLSAFFRLWVPAFLSVFAVSGASAQTSMSKADSPGWYRMHIGSFEITALSDGTLDLPVDQLFPKVNPDRIRSLLSRSYLAPTISLTVNAFLVNTGTRLVLIDTGTGTSQMFGPKLGHLESGSERIFVWGDLMHVAALQFPLPSATFETEWSTTKSAQQRQAVFADVASHGYYAAAAHVAFPGIGKLRADGDGYSWVPVSYIFGK